MAQTAAKVVYAFSNFAVGNPLVFPLFVLGSEHGIARILLKAVFHQFN
jgi:hypothetical protein